MDIIGMSVSASAVILLVMALRRLFPSAVAGGTAKLLWLTAAARLLIPFGNISVVTLSISDNAVYESREYFSLPSISITADIPEFMRLMWIFGAVFTGALFLFKHIKTRRKFSCALPCEYNLEPLLTEYKIRRRVTLCVSDLTDTPFTYGVIFPRIIIPKFAAKADEAQLKNILCHELGHIKSFDVIYKAVLAACAAVHWFDPLVWAMLALAERDVELACDRSAVLHGKCAPDEYAMTLINMEERRSELCEPSFTGGSLKERVVSIMSGRRSRCPAVTVFAAVLTLAAAVCANFYCQPIGEAASVETAADMLFIVSDDNSTASSEESVIDTFVIQNTNVGTAFEYGSDEVYIFSVYAEETAG